MSIFSIFKKKLDKKAQIQKEVTVDAPKQPGIAISKKIELDIQNKNSIGNCCIAFDVETTGLDPTSDRIVETHCVQWS